MKKRIIEAIKELKLTEKDLDCITFENLNKICMIAKCSMIDLMKYLRYER